MRKVMTLATTIGWLSVAALSAAEHPVKRIERREERPGGGVRTPEKAKIDKWSKGQKKGAFNDAAAGKAKPPEEKKKMDRAAIERTAQAKDKWSRGQLTPKFKEALDRKHPTDNNNGGGGGGRSGGGAAPPPGPGGGGPKPPRR